MSLADAVTVCDPIALLYPETLHAPARPERTSDAEQVGAAGTKPK